MFTRLMESLATTEALSAIFSDENVLGCMLAFEAALARAEARTGVIPGDAAHRTVEESSRKTGSPPDLPGLRKPEEYLGSPEAFRVRLLEGKE